MTVLYTNHCPLCELLKDLLDLKKIDYVMETDVQKMIELGLENSPMPRLQTSEHDHILTYKEALEWLKEKR